LDYQYVTTDTGGLKIFRGTGTGREILVNGDPEGRIVLLREPSKEEMKVAIEEYYSLRINLWWDNIIMRVCTDQKHTLHPLQLAPFANGFRAIFIHDRGLRKPELEYLRNPPLRRTLPDSPYHRFTDYCVSLPLRKQIKLLKALRPTGVEDLYKVVHLKVIPVVLPVVNLFECLEQSDSALSLLDRLLRILQGKEEVLIGRSSDDYRRTPGLDRLLEFLAWVNQKGWLLLNKKTLLSLRYTSSAKRQWTLVGSFGRPPYWNTKPLKLAEVIMKEYRQVSGTQAEDMINTAYMRLCLLLRSSTIDTIGDFSPELLNFNESNLELARGREATTIIRRMTDSIVRTYKKDRRYAHIDFPVIKRTHIGRDYLIKPEESLRSKGFRWVLEEHPEFQPWVELIEGYTKSVKMQWAGHFFLNLNRWFDYISGLKNPPLTPEEIDRAKHIRNVSDQSINTFWKFLSAELADANLRNSALTTMRRFFDYYQDKLISDYKGFAAQAPLFPNPIKADDRWNPVDRKGKTERCALPSDLLDLLREILLDPDQDGKPTFNWVKNHPTFRLDWMYEVDPETKETVHVWWPGRTVAMYVLLTLPLRSFQVRWLDEGIGDEYIYDFDKQRLVPNSHPSAEAGRREGLFRLVQDPFEDRSFLGLWVNTNKTKLYDPTAVRGYEIPWPNDELFSMLRVMQEWNNKYFPNPKPVTFANDNARLTTEAARPYLPKFYLLFRDKKGSKRDPHLPIYREKLARLWAYLLWEAQNRLKTQGRQIELIELRTLTSSTGYKYKEPKAKYDLHSLRVSGITSLIAKGVPVHIVSEYIAGHSTIIMTLYYEKLALYEVRAELLRAQEKAEADVDGCLTLIDLEDDPESILVSNKFEYSSNAAFRALKANKGLWQVDFAGICPGTLCEEGGPPDVNGKGMPVPTGSCGLCRFYITGPAFLFGQMQKLNNLVYSMREKGEELCSLRLEIIDLEDGGSRRALAKARNRHERLERELKDGANEWFNRYRLYQASSAMLDQYQEKKKKHAKGNKSLMPLLTANTQDGFKTVVKEGTNVDLVRQISLMHEILGNFDLHKGPLLEYEEILNTILVNNGFEALLLTIPKEKRVSAANMLGEFLITSVGDDAIDKLSTRGNAIPKSLHEQTQELIEYLKSEKFVVDPPVRPLGEFMPQQYVQIQGLKA
jgi:hypothetical protein